MRKSKGLSKPQGVMKVSEYIGAIRVAFEAPAQHRPVARPSVCRRRSLSVYVGTRKMVNYA